MGESIPTVTPKSKYISLDMTDEELKECEETLDILFELHERGKEALAREEDTP